jgi:hypothetical protein
MRQPLASCRTAYAYGTEECSGRGNGSESDSASPPLAVVKTLAEPSGRALGPCASQAAQELPSRHHVRALRKASKP